MITKQHLHTVSGKLEVHWLPEARAILDTWTDYFIPLEEFKKAVLEIGLGHSKANGGRAWIVDSSKAKGSFPQVNQDFIGSDIFPAFANNGVQYFMTITSESVLTKMTIASYQVKTGPNGLHLVEVNSVDDAVEWLLKNAKP